MTEVTRSLKNSGRDLGDAVAPIVERQKFWPCAEEVTAAIPLALPVVQREYLIGGELRTWSGEQERVYSPICTARDGKPEPIELGSYPRVGSAEAVEAITKAHEAFTAHAATWPLLSMEQRCQAVERFVEGMLSKRSEVINLLMLEIGKTLKDSEKEFDRTVDYIRESVAYARGFAARGAKVRSRDGVAYQSQPRPVGPILCISPYNYPLNETYQALFPALLLGNTVVIKPPKYGVLLHGPLLETFQRSFPPGVVNMIYGDGATLITPIMKSGLVAKLSFIGGENTAKRILENDPEHVFKRPYLGLGAKNIALITSSADLEATVREVVTGALSYNGQRCTALKMLFVHESVAARFQGILVEAVQKLKAGMPWEPGVQITPLPSVAEAKRMGELLEDARAFGAKILNEGGGRVDGTFVTPAVLAPLTKEMRLFREEQFGPLVCVAHYKESAEVIEYLRTSSYGQQASIFSTDEREVGELIPPFSLLVARINLNAQCQRGPDEAPFAARKLSGSGILSVSAAFEEFSLPGVVASKDAGFLSGVLQVR